MAPEKLKSARAAESVALHIEELILEGSLRPGEQLLPERELAGRLNVSRPTLREGIRMLEDKGLLAGQAGAATEVAPLGTSLTDPLIALLAARVDMVDDYLEFRTGVETMAASLAATRANAVDLDAIRAAMDRIDAAHERGDPRDEADADADLHIAIYEASHNVVLLQVMRALAVMLRTGVLRNRDTLFALPRVRDFLRDQHRTIFEAILARDPAAAGAAAQAHLDYTRQALREIREAESRLEMSLRRVDHGNVTTRSPSRADTVD